VADVLYWARVVEHGTHEELMEQAGTYCELFQIQASSYQ
jgi:ABC-type multidrug transport system fused ATPase/permease subunit